ncbi:tetratricopeptide repeat protein [Acetobacter fallax]|uniref:tetratricopeptide repeat protein n=1 Tax=Acetobacter fallax TaxID=1737473 RepID=UPI00156BCF27
MWAEGHALLARLLWQTGMHTEAMASFQKAIELQPEKLEWKLAFLDCQMRRGDEAGAVPELLKIVSDNINDANTVISAVSIIGSVARHDIAIRCLKWCLGKRPDEATLKAALASELISAGQVAEGCALFIKLIQQSEKNIYYLPVLVSAPGWTGAFEQALQIAEFFYGMPNTEHPSLLSNIGNLMIALNRSKEAMPFYERAFLQSPENEQMRFGLAVAYLKSGDYEKGWKQNELRPSVQKLPESKPWRGKGSISGKTLLLPGDQGMGDVIQFVRYIPYLTSLGARLILVVCTPLVRLFRTLPWPVEVRDLSEQISTEHDFNCPLLSLPLALMHYIGTEIPHDVPYFFPYAKDVSRFAWLRDKPGRKKIGLVWSGRARPEYGIAYRARSTSLEAFAPITSQAGVTFVNLQFGEPAGELQSLKGISIVDPMNDVRDMADTAAIIENLDLVISVDTSVAHLAGALGKPVWMLTRSDCCWRWLENRDDTPWYPTMRIFRSQPGSLDHAIALAAEELQRVLHDNAPEAACILNSEYEALT